MHSTALLRRILTLRRPGWRDGRSGRTGGSIQFLHTLPHLGWNDSDALWNKQIVRHSAAGKDVFARLKVCHGDTLVAAAPQGGFFIQLECLSNIVDPDNDQLGRVDALHFAHHKILSQDSHRTARSTGATASHK